MSKTVKQILEWESTKGSQKSLIVVTDDSVPSDDISHKKLELAQYASDKDKWETEETLDYISEFDSYGIPESLIS